MPERPSVVPLPGHDEEGRDEKSIGAPDVCSDVVSAGIFIFCSLTGLT